MQSFTECDTLMDEFDLWFSNPMIDFVRTRDKIDSLCRKRYFFVICADKKEMMDLSIFISKLYWSDPWKNKTEWVVPLQQSLPMAQRNPTKLFCWPQFGTITLHILRRLKESEGVDSEEESAEGEARFDYCMDRKYSFDSKIISSYFAFFRVILFFSL